jgi:uncharacterized protein YkwD
MSDSRRKAFSLILALLALLSASPLAQAQEHSTTSQSREEAIAYRLIHQINELRQQRGLPPFLVSEALNRAATLQSQDMVTYNFFDHTSPVAGRSRPHDRAVASGYSSTTIAENLFMSMGTPDDGLAAQCFQTWLQSPGHLQNLLDRQRTEIGVGVASNSQQETYITAVFGRP